MKCVDRLKTMNYYAGDLEIVRRHLESCPECSRRFARDLEIEYALRDLGLGVAPIDITAEVRNSLGLLNKRRFKCGLVRKWVWVTVSAAILVLLIITMPILAGWLNEAYDLVNSFHIGRSIKSAISFYYFEYLFYLMMAVLVWVITYLWRETRRTVRWLS